MFLTYKEKMEKIEKREIVRDRKLGVIFSYLTRVYGRLWGRSDEFKVTRTE